MKGLWMGLMAHPQLVDVFFSDIVHLERRKWIIGKSVC